MTAARRDPAAGVAACADLSYGSDDRLACVATVSTMARPAAAPALIEACAGMVYGSDDRLACVRELAVTRFDPVEVVDYCAASSYGSDDRIACLAQFR